MVEEYSNAPVLKTLAVTDLVGSTHLVEKLGDERAAEVFSLHDRLARDLLTARSGREIDKSDGFLLLFERPIDAVRFALEYHDGLRQLSEEVGVALASRVGIHLGEIIVRSNPAEDVVRGAKPVEVEGLAKSIAARLMSVGLGGQTLLTRTAFDVARRAAEGGGSSRGQLRWLAHGPYEVHGVNEPLELFEVGIHGESPLTPPPDSAKVERVYEDGGVLGWRPAAGLEIPRRPSWIVERKLGQGGSGDVWLAGHRKTHAERVFKFCNSRDDVHALQREITVYRLLRETLGERADIAHIVDWSLDEAPYFIECEYSAGGDLSTWAEARGGLSEIPMAVRLGIVAQVAETLAAAHSVGVLHKDVKPGNILVAVDSPDDPRTRLADFGVGQVTDRERLDRLGITQLGLTEHADDRSSTRSGTYMYMAPEVLEGKPPTLHADIYALGVLLYQMVVGDLESVLAPGWQREIEDEIVVEDIADCVDRSPERRPGDAHDVARRLRTLETRRDQRQEERRQREEAQRARAVLERTRRRRRIGVVATAAVLVFGVSMAILARRAMIEAGRANREAEAADQVSQFLVELFKGSDPGRARGDAQTAREMLDLGAERVRTELVDQPLIQARLMHTIGRVYVELGINGPARELLEESLRIGRQELGDHEDVATVLDVLGVVYVIDGRPEEGERLLREAVAMYTTVYGDLHQDTARAQMSLGRALQVQERYDEAELLYRDALTVQRALHGPHHRDVGRCLHNLGTLQMTVGKQAEAESSFRAAVEALSESVGSDDPSVSVAMAALAQALRGQGKAREAEPLLREALEAQRRVFGDQHYFVAGTASSLGMVYRDLGDLDSAENLVREALAINRTLFGDDHDDVIFSMDRLAGILHRKGDLGGAIALYERVLEARRQEYAADDPQVVGVEEDLATARAELQRSEQ